MINIDEIGYKPFADAIKHKCVIPDSKSIKFTLEYIEDSRNALF